MNKLSVVLATYNEELNLGRCLESVKNIASEIVVVDGSSRDATVDIAKKFGAKVIITENHKIFHINKQKAIEMAINPWILLMDADEVVTESLAHEISIVTNMTEADLVEYQNNLKNKKIFAKHKSLLEERDGKIGDNSLPYAGFFIPRLNYFLGGYLRYGGVYPDGVIRLVKNGKAYLPAKDVHEQIVVEGKVGWLKSDLLHIDSPTYERYLQRNSRYIDLLADEIRM
jgi:glycosyltransferase involved in cell wall biosynthesis